MIDTRYLKIVVLCCEETRTRLKNQLACDRNDTIFFNDGDDALTCVIREDFDVFMVDSLHPEAARICRSVYSSIRPPVALLVEAGAANWSEFGGWDVDGFISDDASAPELLARLRAISRRPAKKNCMASV